MKNAYSTLFKILLGILYVILTFGIFGPMLLSAKSGVAVGLGVLVVFVIPAFVSVYLINKFYPKND